MIPEVCKLATSAGLLGDWYEENQRLCSALEFAGYEVEHRWDKGGHNSKNGLLAFKDAMIFLWQGWPAEVGLGTSSNKSLERILPEGSVWTEDRTVTAGYLYALTRNGIEICDHNGRVRAILATPPGYVKSFKLSDGTIYISVNGRIFSRPLKTRSFMDADKVTIPKREGQG